MLPFEDIKVIDFSQRLPGPYCSSILADMGAEVIMVERAGSPPVTRKIFPGLFELINRNKRSITINMKSIEGKEIAQRLIRQSDILIEEFRPGVAGRLGIGYNQVKEINSTIIYCSISGFGQDGPYRDRVGHDINYMSLSGILSIPGQPDTPPSRPGVPVVDLASGMYAVISIMAALRKRDRESVGEYIDVSMFDNMIPWMGIRAGRYLVYGEKPENDHLSPLNNIYETRDGKGITLGIIEQHFWENFCKAVNREGLMDDPRFQTPKGRQNHSRALTDILKEIISDRSLGEWEEVLDWREVPYAPVHSMEEAINDPHVVARNLIQEIGTDESGKIREVVFPVKFAGFDTAIRSVPPEWGQHTDEVLKELNYSDDEIIDLKDKGSV